MGSVEPTCPRCGEPRLIFFDPTLRVWVCQVCSQTWKVHLDIVK
jgi:hypothetical protein